MSVVGDLWERHALPRLIPWVCGGRPITRQRAKVIPLARGEVLEIGFGSGMNLPHYDRRAVTRLVAVDPAPDQTVLAGPRLALAAFPVALVHASAEALPLPDAAFDTVVTTFTLCSILDVAAALAELRRVLRPGGALLFAEHGLAPDRGVRLAQRALDPLWHRISGGCHLDRPIPALLAAAGFTMDPLEQRYLPGPRWLSYHYWGTATAAR